MIDQARDALAAFVKDAPEGSKLPPERELAQRLGVSRTTLRDGVSRLALLGLVEVRHGDGTYVRSPDAAQVALPFQSLVENSPAAVQELLALVELLAPTLAASAAKNASPQDVADMRGALQQERAEVARQENPRRGRPRRNDALALEGLIIDAAGQVLVGSLVRMAMEMLRPQALDKLPQSFRQLLVEQRSAVVEAIAIGEPEAARGAMELYLRTLGKAVGAGPA